MKCGGCVGHVKKILEAQENVVEVSSSIVEQHNISHSSIFL
jgi:copper chaperone CopZ